MTSRVGSFILPSGIESAFGILTNILMYLDIRSLWNVKISCLIRQLGKAFDSDDFESERDIALCLSYQGIRSINELILSYQSKRLYLLIEKYKTEILRFTEIKQLGHYIKSMREIAWKLIEEGKISRSTVNVDDITTPFMFACEEGRIDDVKLFMNLYPFHKYITNYNVNGYRNNMTLKEYVNQIDKAFELDDNGNDVVCTPLIAAAKGGHFEIVKYLIEECEADPNIANSNGWNALHYAADYNTTNDIRLIKFLLNHMSIEAIKKKDIWGNTPLDVALDNDQSEVRLKILIQMVSFM